MSHDQTIEFEFNQITPEIFVGTDLCCQQHFNDKFGPLGITAAISLQAEKEDHIGGLEYFLWLPVIDQQAPSVGQLQLGVETLVFFVTNQIKVYVHCRWGHGRSVSLVIAYLISTGMTFEEAHSLVKAKRPEIHLETVQIDALKDFEEKHLWIQEK